MLFRARSAQESSAPSSVQGGRRLSYKQHLQNKRIEEVHRDADDKTSQLVNRDQSSPRANSDEIQLSTDSSDDPGAAGFETRPAGIKGNAFQSASKLLFDSQDKL